MRIAMRTDLVAGLRDLTHLLGKRLDRMAGDEPGSFDLVALVQAQQPWGAHLASEKATRNIERRILTAVGAEPARDRPRPAEVAALVDRLRRPGDVSFPLSKRLLWPNPSKRSFRKYRD